MIHPAWHFTMCTLKMKVKVAQFSDSLRPHRLYSPRNSPGQNTGVGSLSLLQGTVPTQGLNPSLLRCRQILYQLSHKRSPRILEWVAYPFSSRSSRPRNGTWVSCIAGRFFTNWTIKEYIYIYVKLAGWQYTAIIFILLSKLWTSLLFHVRF